jgi:hypothetical protein
MADPAEKLSPEAEALMERFRKLPSEEQRRFAKLALALAEPPELSSAWKREIANRLKSIEDGTAVLLDGDEVMRELRAKYGS